MRFAWALALVLAGCTLGGGKLATSADGAKPIQDDAIEVTSLDDAALAKPREAAAAVKPDAPEAAPETASAKPDAAKPDSPPSPAMTPDPAAVPAAAPAPPVVLSPEALACQKSGGAWSVAGRSGGMACVRMMKDAGKSCRKQSDCEGSCLARSNTCAPIAPLFGCNEILQDNGVMVTLCID